MITNFQKKNKLFFKNVLAFVVAILFFACNNNKPDVSKINVDLKIDRFEQDLFATDTSWQSILKIAKKYPTFFDLFNENITDLGDFNKDKLNYQLALHGFLNDKYIQTIFKDVEKKYNDITDITQSLNEAMRYFRYYFPNKPLPHVITFISGFNYSVATTDSILAIGLDLFLGKNYEYYKLSEFPQYLIDKMDAEYIVPTAVKAWVGANIENTSQSNDLLNEMIYNGKLLYTTQLLLPDSSENVIMLYTKEQLKFCKENEFNIWAHFIDNKLLYSKKHDDFIKYINDGPFTPGLPRQAPARIGTWIGLQIVKAYMKRNANTSLETLYKLDVQTILNQSKYKPKH